MRGQQTTAAAAAAAARTKLYFPSGRAPSTVATKLFIAFGRPVVDWPGPARPGRTRHARPATRRDELRCRPLGRPGNDGPRVSDPFGDGSSSPNYICHVADRPTDRVVATAVDVCAVCRSILIRLAFLQI